MNRKPQVSAAEYFAMREDDIVNVGEMTSPQIVVVLKYDLDDIGACAVEVANGRVNEQQLDNLSWVTSTTFRVLLPSDVSVEDFVMSLASVSEWNPVKVLEKSTVEEADWVQRVRDSFRPIHIGRLYIRCPWHTPPQATRVLEQVDMVIHPGMGFGTGEHPTTKLCLDWLQRTIRGGEKLLDYGSGSGILSIAASLLGCAICHGVEIDLDSIRNAEENKSLNNLSNVSFFQPLDAPVCCYDVIVANILFHPLVDLVEKFSQCSRRGTRIALSGILFNQAETLRATYEGVGFRMEDSIIDNEWCLIAGEKL